MAKFKVGDKAKMINCDATPNPNFRNCNGDEVTILAVPGYDAAYPMHYRITRPQHWTGPSWKDEFMTMEFRLAPLTDPKADESFQRFMDTLLRTDTPLVMYARALDRMGVKA